MSTEQELIDENARLKAEIEELRLENGAFKRTVNQASVHYDNRLADIARLKAEVESLKRAGDLMLKYACANMPYPPYVTIAKDWISAKDGKPSV